ncbi:antibiotic biosynthesis monooxygenase [Streptomyces sp. NPDC048516]|uniref:antibiotic biosynthesis monooxygenase n=1 Tax=Streptomyces sp. NPDC048516 TaxID=3365565 RepID=UPI00371D438F
MTDMPRCDADTILVSEWIVDTPERQQAAAEALLGEWRELCTRVQPEAFRQLSCFGRLDGRLLLSVARWASDEAHLAFMREHRAAMVGRIDQEVPGIQRPGLMRYRLLHSVLPDAAPESADALSVLRAEARAAEAVRSWADRTAVTLREAATAMAGPTHVLVSADGLHALLAAWMAPHDRWDHWGRHMTAAGEGIEVHDPQRYHLLGSVYGPRHRVVEEPRGL